MRLQDILGFCGCGTYLSGPFNGNHYCMSFSFCKPSSSTSLKSHSSLPSIGSPLVRLTIHASCRPSPSHTNRAKSARRSPATIRGAIFPNHPTIEIGNARQRGGASSGPPRNATLVSSQVVPFVQGTPDTRCRPFAARIWPHGRFDAALCRTYLLRMKHTTRR